MTDNDRNEDLSPAQVAAYQICDLCPKPCIPPLVGGRSFTDMAQAAVDTGVNTEHCVRGIPVQQKGSEDVRVPCPYGQAHPGFVKALVVLTAASHG